MTAHDIVNGLRLNRHSKDLFFTEIGEGGSKFDSGSGGHKLDAWAATRSWSKPRYVGYEVKVSRRDFVQDNKWQAYLPSCTEFWFVVAPGCCQPEEIGDQCGLLVATKTCQRFMIKKKAPALRGQFRYERAFNMLKTALMRQWQGPRDLEASQTPEQVLELLRQDHEDKLTGSRIGYELARRRRALDQREDVLKKREEAVAEARKALSHFGLRADSSAWKPVEDQLRALIRQKGRVSDGLRERMRRLASELAAIEQHLAEFQVPVAEENGRGAEEEETLLDGLDLGIKL